MKTTFHGVTVEVDDLEVRGLDIQKVQAALLKYGCDIHEEYMQSAVDFDPPILVHLSVERSQERVTFKGSIKHQSWSLWIS